MVLPQTRLSRGVDRLLTGVGRVVGWLWLALLLTIVTNVATRYLAGRGFIQLEEMQWHLYAAGFLLGIVIAYQSDSHIRVDLLRDAWSARTRAWIELYGTLLALLPFILLVILYGLPFVASSFAASEVSQAPGGLPFRWLVKALLPLSFTLLLLAVLSRLSRIWKFLFGDGTATEHPASGRHADER